MRISVPGVLVGLEQKTSILCKRLYLLSVRRKPLSPFVAQFLGRVRNRAGNARGLVQAGLRAHHDPLSGDVLIQLIL
jgi:hypothetical protein